MRGKSHFSLASRAVVDQVFVLLGAVDSELREVLSYPHASRDFSEDRRG